ncbi:MAG: c-type cytochrome [Thermoanaerobaculia bacterium]
MNQLKVFLLVILGVALVAVAGAAIFLGIKQPSMRPAAEMRVEATPELLERGRYLAQNVSDCLGCHSEQDPTKFGMPVKPGTEGAGGTVFTKAEGVPGSVAARNITPDAATGIGNWSDGEIVRAIREGVRHDGTPLFPMMPYPDYKSMSDDDVKALVAYLRTLPARQHSVPERKLDFPVNMLVKFMPHPVDGIIPAPPAGDSVRRGAYLVLIGNCKNCHTPRDGKGRPIAAEAFSGGWEMVGPWGRVVTANLTPHPSNFMGQATREQFIARFKAFEGTTWDSALPATPGRNTVMPWLGLSGMTEDDLGAIYDYLKTLPPVDKRVVTFPDAGTVN